MITRHFFHITRIRAKAFKQFFDENPDSLLRIIQVGVVGGCVVGGRGRWWVCTTTVLLNTY